MKKPTVIAFGLLIVLCGGGYYVFGKFRGQSAENKPKPMEATVVKGDLTVKVIETGTVDAVKVVEVKSRVAGRVSELRVKEGDRVTKGQVIAIIDPKETQLRVDQDSAQLRASESEVARINIQIQQRVKTAQTAYKQAVSRLEQAKLESGVQPTITDATVRGAQASLSSLQTERKRLVETAQPNARTASDRELSEAQSNYETAKADYDRQYDLLKKGYVAGKVVENAKLAMDLSKARWDAAKENAKRLEAGFKSELEKVDRQIEQAKAELERAQANSIQDQVKRKQVETAILDVERAQADLRDVDMLRRQRDGSQATVDRLRSAMDDSLRQLSETEILAPMDGVITKRLVEVGELVASLSSFSSGTPIVRLEDQTAMLIKLNVNEIDIVKLALGMPVEIVVDAIQDKTLKGKVSKISPASNLGVGGAPSSDPVVKYAVEVLLTDVDPRLKSGMSAKCTMITLSRPGVLLLPLEFVGKEGTDRFVMLAPASAKEAAKKQIVKVGAQSGSQIEILSGVSVGQKVVKPDFKGPAMQGAMMVKTDD